MSDVPTTPVAVDLTHAEMLALGYALGTGEARARREGRGDLAAAILSIWEKVHESNDRAAARARR